jgi:hypothetical protein
MSATYGKPITASPTPLACWCWRRSKPTGRARQSPPRAVGARLPETLEAAEKRELTIYGTTDAEEIAEVL